MINSKASKYSKNLLLIMGIKIQWSKAFKVREDHLQLIYLNLTISRLKNNPMQINLLPNNSTNSNLHLHLIIPSTIAYLIIFPKLKIYSKFLINSFETLIWIKPIQNFNKENITQTLFKWDNPTFCKIRNLKIII